MFRTLAPRRRAVASALLATVLGTLALGAAAPARAQSTTLNFNSLAVTDGSGVRYVNNCYTESGFTVTAVGVACGTAGSFATAGAADPTLWTGSPALFLNDPVATKVAFSEVGGGLFSMQSIGFAPFLGSAASVMLTGFLQNGSTVSQTCSVPSSGFGVVPPLATCSLGSAFTGLSSLQFAAMDSFGEPIAEFDNVVVTSSGFVATPEPTTIALMAGGLLGVASAARRRRQSRA